MDALPVRSIRIFNFVPAHPIDLPRGSIQWKSATYRSLYSLPTKTHLLKCEAKKSLQFRLSNHRYCAWILKELNYEAKKKLQSSISAYLWSHVKKNVCTSQFRQFSYLMKLSTVVHFNIFLHLLCKLWKWTFLAHKQQHLSFHK